MIMNDPWIHLQRRGQMFRAILMVLTGTIFLACIVSLFLPTFTISPNFIFSILLTGSIFIFATRLFLSERSALKRRIQQYQRLLAGDSDLLAQKQPSPNEHALSLPTTIILRPKIGMIRPLSGMLMFMALAFAGLTTWALVAFFTTPYNAYSASGDLIFATTGSSAVLIFGGAFWFLRWRSHSWIKVTKTGLEAQWNKQKMQINWEEARIFSVGGVIGPEQAHIYTLSGEQKIVVWIQFMSESQAGIYQPMLSFDLYHQQSQALCDVIASKTNLPLYDIHIPAKKRYN